jgi:hypothetical protein
MNIQMKAKSMKMGQICSVVIEYAIFMRNFIFRFKKSLVSLHDVNIFMHQKDQD